MLKGKQRIRRWRKRRKRHLPFQYCKFKKPCVSKRIKRESKGVYLVICEYSKLCTQQTTMPQKIELEKDGGLENQVSRTVE